MGEGNPRQFQQVTDANEIQHEAFMATRKRASGWKSKVCDFITSWPCCYAFRGMIALQLCYLAVLIYPFQEKFRGGAMLGIPIGVFSYVGVNHGLNTKIALGAALGTLITYGWALISFNHVCGPPEFYTSDLVCSEGSCPVGCVAGSTALFIFTFVYLEVVFPNLFIIWIGALVPAAFLLPVSAFQPDFIFADLVFGVLSVGLYAIGCAWSICFVLFPRSATGDLHNALKDGVQDLQNMLHLVQSLIFDPPEGQGSTKGQDRKATREALRGLVQRSAGRLKQFNFLIDTAWWEIWHWGSSDPYLLESIASTLRPHMKIPGKLVHISRAIQTLSERAIKDSEVEDFALLVKQRKIPLVADLVDTLEKGLHGLSETLSFPDHPKVMESTHGTGHSKPSEQEKEANDDTVDSLDQLEMLDVAKPRGIQDDGTRGRLETKEDLPLIEHYFIQRISWYVCLLETLGPDCATLMGRADQYLNARWSFCNVRKNIKCIFVKPSQWAVNQAVHEELYGIPSKTRRTLMYIKKFTWDSLAVKYALKATAALMVFATFAFVDSTQYSVFYAWIGQNVTIGIVTNIKPNVAQTVWSGILQMIGVFLGPLWGLITWYIADMPRGDCFCECSPSVADCSARDCFNDVRAASLVGLALLFIPWAFLMMLNRIYFPKNAFAGDMALIFYSMSSSFKIVQSRQVPGPLGSQCATYYRDIWDYSYRSFVGTLIGVLVALFFERMFWPFQARSEVRANYFSGLKHIGPTISDLLNSLPGKGSFSGNAVSMLEEIFQSGGLRLDIAESLDWDASVEKNFSIRGNMSYPQDSYAKMHKLGSESLDTMIWLSLLTGHCFERDYIKKVLVPLQDDIRFVGRDVQEMYLAVADAFRTKRPRRPPPCGQKRIDDTKARLAQISKNLLSLLRSKSSPTFLLADIRYHFAILACLSDVLDTLGRLEDTVGEIFGVRPALELRSSMDAELEGNHSEYE